MDFYNNQKGNDGNINQLLYAQDESSDQSQIQPQQLENVSHL